MTSVAMKNRVCTEQLYHYGRLPAMLAAGHSVLPLPLISSFFSA